MSPLVISRFCSKETATTELYTLSLHDALPIWRRVGAVTRTIAEALGLGREHVEKRMHWVEHHPAHLASAFYASPFEEAARSEEHTSELQSPDHLVCRLLLEKKKIKYTSICRNT